MIKNILGAGLVLAAFSTSSFAATAAAGFYVELDAKSHKCIVSDKAPDGKTMMDVGTKVYANQANAEQAMAALKACNEPAAAMAPAAKAAAPAAAVVAPAAKAAAPAAAVPAAAAGFYVAQDAKTKKCMVSDKAPDGKMMMNVGTKVYENQANAEKAASMLKVCGEAAMAPMAAAGFYVVQDAKTHKCAVSPKAPDGKMAMDVGTKVYSDQANAEKAAAMLKVCQ